jgi:uncharacterized protein (TIGR02453 family)
MAFKGWKAEALEFFERLQAENTKAYWERHKTEYLELVRAPMDALLGELEAEWGEGKVFRPYRDIRFSADKTPYKDHIGATIGRGYVQLSADGLAAGSGMWEMGPDQLERYREAIVADRSGAELERLVTSGRKGGLEVMSHGSLKSAPRGYPKDHPRIELLRWKGLATWRAWPPAAWLGTARAKDRVEGFFQDSAPIVGWLDTHVGPSTMPPGRR